MPPFAHPSGITNPNKSAIEILGYISIASAFHLMIPNPEQAEAKKKIYHETTKGPRLNREERFNGAGENTKKDRLNFVLSKFRVFVMKIFFHKIFKLDNHSFWD